MATASNDLKASDSKDAKPSRWEQYRATQEKTMTAERIAQLVKIGDGVVASLLDDMTFSVPLMPFKTRHTKIAEQVGGLINDECIYVPWVDDDHTSNSALFYYIKRKLEKHSCFEMNGYCCYVPTSFTKHVEQN